MVGELDTDPIASEPVHQIRQRHLGGFRTAFGKRLAHMAFATPGQNLPVSTGSLGERVEVVLGLTLLAAGQVRGGKLTREPAVTLRTAGQHQQMRAGRVWHVSAGAASSRAQRQFGSEYRADVEFAGRLGEAHHAIESVMIGQRDSPQIQPRGLLDEFLRRAGPVEEAVRRMRVQLGVGHCRAHGWLIGALIGTLVVLPLARPGRAVTAVASGSARLSRTACQPGAACC